MKIVKLMIFVLVSLLLITGCTTEQKKSELSKNISVFLEKNFGINTSVNILFVKTNWFEGAGEYAIFNIQKPYPMKINHSIDGEKMNIDSYEPLSEMYSELFKGAFVAEHPLVMKTTEKIIKEYSLIKEDVDVDTPKEYRDQYYYLYTMFDESQVTELIQKLKQEKTIKTDKILPTLKKVQIDEDPLSMSGNINFHFYMEVNKLAKLNKIPIASSIMKSYESANVLPEGNYCIYIDSYVHDKTGTSLGYDKRNSAVIFDVDKSGGFHVVKQLDSFE